MVGLEHTLKRINSLFGPETVVIKKCLTLGFCPNTGSQGWGVRGLIV